jgi:riboflavin synthase
MFTGIIEEVGEVLAVVRRGGGGGIEVRARRVLADLREGDSIAVSGACLTIVALSSGGFRADLSAETFRRTTLGRARPGARVNLERSLPLGGRLGGHLVQGHVDGTARVVRRQAQDANTEYLEIELPFGLQRYVAEKGSLAVDGVSLTVGGVRGRRAWFYLIPRTLAETTLADCRPPAEVNIEVDLLARYLDRLRGAPGADAPSDPTQGRTGRDDA